MPSFSVQQITLSIVYMYFTDKMSAYKPALLLIFSTTLK